MNTEVRKKFEVERNGLGEDPRVQWDLVKQTLSAPLSLQAWSRLAAVEDIQSIVTKLQWPGS